MFKGRPKKERIISAKPLILQFSPRGRRGRPDYISIGPDEFEAIRLNDFMKIAQNYAAKHMGISQQTFSRILSRARRSLADALVNGKIIRIADKNTKIQSPAQKSSPKIREEGRPEAE
ncbi:MAG: DUF134 domain-containing protein [Candidatus Omnitrophica bacterium]|nr:DUF134 domain-containing protein [Candidatus Omnitrophota bacterium]MDD5237025.1 DUF134 domain-containing protein [Candidatus Omnitrophota bacterium]MDD5610447.1 DUF134 domain-containing protein [Candidatus Omnitrophota bacterium]